MWMRRWLSLAFVALVAAGCQAAAPSPSDEQPVVVAIPTAEPAAGQLACMDALYSGVLVADEDMGVAVEAADGTTIVVVWPHGWAAVDEDGARVVVNERGDPVAQVGDEVAIGGGQGPDGRWHTCGEVTRGVP
jgi:hypothetical protein